MLNDEGMQVWAVFYHQTQLSEKVSAPPSLYSSWTLVIAQLYHAGLQLVDTDSQARIKRFYQRNDACRES